VTVVTAGEKVGTAKIPAGSPGAVTANAKDSLKPLVARGQEKDVVKEVTIMDNLKPPLKAGDKVGAITAKLYGKVLASTDAVAARDVKRANFIIRFFRWVKGLFTGLFK
jgi:D-alanyl-D-alanine carboxypeptidase